MTSELKPLSLLFISILEFKKKILKKLLIGILKIKMSEKTKQSLL